MVLLYLPFTSQFSDYVFWFFGFFLFVCSFLLFCVICVRSFCGFSLLFSSFPLHSSPLILKYSSFKPIRTEEIHDWRRFQCRVLCFHVVLFVPNRKKQINFVVASLDWIDECECKFIISNHRHIHWNLFFVDNVQFFIWARTHHSIMLLFIHVYQFIPIPICFVFHPVT